MEGRPLLQPVETGRPRSLLRARRPRLEQAGDVKPSGLFWLAGLAFVLALVLPCSNAKAKDPAVGEPSPGEPAKSVRVASTFTITEENDLFAGTDYQYTNGTKLQWISGDISLYAKEHPLPQTLQSVQSLLPFLNQPGMQHNMGLSLSQTIFTPRDIHTSLYQPHDRPYAGWLNLGLALHAKTPYHLDTFELGLGVVGPASLAEEAQNTTHRIIGDREAKGWAHQIEDEPTLQLAWQHTLRTYRHDFSNDWAFDLLPHFGATAGNALDQANAGFEMRFGYQLPWDFGTSLIMPGGGISAPAAQNDERLEKGPLWGAHVFIGADGRAIARNITLDGNTWRPSHSVPKNNFVGDLMAGAGILLGPVKITYTHVLRSPEFVYQKGPQYFGSVDLSFTF